MAFTEEQRKEAEAFYREAIDILQEGGADFLLGGGFAMFHYTGIFRDTKDLDIFCRSADYPAIMKLFSAQGYKTELHDVRWLAKVFKSNYFIDIIFDTTNQICTVDESWFENASCGEFVGRKVKFVGKEEVIWCKSYVQNRERFDGADVHHLILKQGKNMNWQRVLERLNQHWHILLAELIMFQFIYPADYRDIIPKWLFDELMKRAQGQYELPPAVQKVCRGPIIDNTQYSVDVKTWDYKSFTIMTT